MVRDFGPVINLEITLCVSERVKRVFLALALVYKMLRNSAGMLENTLHKPCFPQWDKQTRYWEKIDVQPQLLSRYARFLINLTATYFKIILRSEWNNWALYSTWTLCAATTWLFVYFHLCCLALHNNDVLQRQAMFELFEAVFELFIWGHVWAIQMKKSMALMAASTNTAAASELKLQNAQRLQH